MAFVVPVLSQLVFISLWTLPLVSEFSLLVGLDMSVLPRPPGCLSRGTSVTVLDDLSTGFEKLVLPGTELVRARAGSIEAKELFKRGKFDAVMHFAAKALAGESVEKPAESTSRTTSSRRAS